MKKNILITIILLFCLVCFSVKFSEDYYGLDFEFQKNNIVDTFVYSDYLSNNTFDLLFTYGPKATGPFRFRGGLGCFELSKYYVTAGVQFKLIELLTNAKGRAFGIYAAADFKMGMDYIDANLSGELFVPLSAISGIQLGIGIDHTLSPFVSLSYSGGLYPMQLSE